ncbi:MBL fold metallo-hydrolase [Leifsonia poae]|uniref:MBL fold metallo-hydrolase n=1 Tax=Leifsonia poae TaxID=110933 RepID=UPI003D686758
MPNELHYEVTTEQRAGVTRDLPEGDADLRWVANSSTLIWGERDAVLVDTFTTTEQNDRLIEWIREHDRTLAAVYITHGHGDHAFGIGQLRAAFPGVRVLATTGTIATLHTQADPTYLAGFWEKLFPGQIPRSSFRMRSTATASSSKGTSCASSRRATRTRTAAPPCGCRASASSWAATSSTTPRIHTSPKPRRRPGRTGSPAWSG